MIVQKILFFIVLSTPLFSDTLKINYTYGLHDFRVENASNALGANAGMYVEYIMDESTQQYASFEVFTEYDDKKLDPDHIPIWFRADYVLKKTLAEEDENFKLNSIFDANWKMNTISSVEQYLKYGFGFEFYFEEDSLSLATKILGGAYYLEIDDDVPQNYGFSRNDLDVGYKAAVMYGASISWSVSEDFSLNIDLEEWNEKGQWLERYTLVELVYEKNETLYIILSAEKTMYNLENFRKGNTEILPWNQDTLFKLSVRLPLNW